MARANGLERWRKNWKNRFHQPLRAFSRALYEPYFHTMCGDRFCPARSDLYSCATRGRRGHTLVELVVVVLIMGIIAAVATPRFLNSLERYRAEAAAQRIRADLELSRRSAKRTSTEKTVQFSPPQGRYTCFGVSDPDHPTLNYDVVLSNTEYPATLDSVSFGGAWSVTFDVYGRPKNAGAWSDAMGTIVVRAGNSQKTVQVDAATGHVLVR